MRFLVGRSIPTCTQLRKNDRLAAVRIFVHSGARYDPIGDRRSMIRATFAARGLGKRCSAEGAQREADCQDCDREEHGGTE
jgi:hypothetical protein